MRLTSINESSFCPCIFIPRLSQGVLRVGQNVQKCAKMANRKKRKRLRWQAANHGCHCFDRVFLLAGACVCCVKFSRTQRTQRKRLRLNGNRALGYSPSCNVLCVASIELYTSLIICVKRFNLIHEGLKAHLTSRHLSKIRQSA